MPASSVVREKNEQCQEKQAEIDKKRRAITSEREDTNKLLETAITPLKMARHALFSLDKLEIDELAQTDVPAEPVQIVCESFVILKGIKDVAWRTVRLLMADEYFLKSLAEIHCEQITQKQLSQCKNHLKVSFFLSLYLPYTLTIFCTAFSFFFIWLVSTLLIFQPNEHLLLEIDFLRSATGHMNPFSHSFSY